MQGDQELTLQTAVNHHVSFAVEPVLWKSSQHFELPIWYLTITESTQQPYFYSLCPFSLTNFTIFYLFSSPSFFVSNQLLKAIDSIFAKSLSHVSHYPNNPNTGSHLCHNFICRVPKIYHANSKHTNLQPKVYKVFHSTCQRLTFQFCFYLHKLHALTLCKSKV